MNISEIIDVYQQALIPVFEDQLQIIYDGEYDDLIHIILDGDKEEFYFTLYGNNAVRLYWHNECFIFDKERNSLVSSDTQGEIVYEEEIEITALPQIIIGLVKYLKDAAFVTKKEQIIGKTPGGYDHIKNYVIQAKGLDGTMTTNYIMGNIRIEICQEEDNERMTTTFL